MRKDNSKKCGDRNSGGRNKENGKDGCRRNKISGGQGSRGRQKGNGNRNMQ